MTNTATNAMIRAHSAAVAPRLSLSKVIGLRTANAIGSAYMANVTKAMSRSPKDSTIARFKMVLMSVNLHGTQCSPDYFRSARNTP